MKISTVLTPSEITALPSKDLGGTTAVVFDVLRATSTMTTAFAHGVAAIYPAQDISEAWDLRKKMPNALLGGERHGEKIEGFDLGNSPLEYRDRPGREIISTTTNGTIALRAVAHAQQVIAGALLNRAAIAEFLRNHPPSRLLLVCAGTGDEFAIEDGLAAGALIAALAADDLDDAGRTLLALWHCHATDSLAVLAQSKNGRRLTERGREAEVEWCAQVDVCPSFGLLDGGALRPFLAS